VFVGFLLIAVSRWPAFTGHWRQAAIVLIVVFVGLAAYRQDAMAIRLRNCSEPAEMFRYEMGKLDLSGKRLYSVRDRKGQYLQCSTGLHHLNTLAVITSHAFVPEIFTIIPPIEPSPENAPYHRGFGVTYSGDEVRNLLQKEGGEGEFQQRLQGFDALLWIHYGQTIPPLPVAMTPAINTRLFSLLLYNSL